jgi:hypothetical protein
MIKDQHIKLTTKSDNYKAEVVEEIQERQMKKIKKYRDYLLESWLDVWTPVDNDDIDYINQN